MEDVESDIFEDEYINNLIERHQKEWENSQEQIEFDKLPQNLKFVRLNNLIQRSQIYSQIILENVLQCSNGNNIKSNNKLTSMDSSSLKRQKIGATDSKSSVRCDEFEKNVADDIEETQNSNIKIKKPIKVSRSISQPKLITGGDLKDYQLDGLEWLVTLYKNGLNGILADEMGLGKTLQCIAFLCFLIENGVPGPFLITVPLSTINTWYGEIKKFAPSLDVFKYAGIKHDRHQIDLINVVKKKKVKVILTSYEVSIKDINKFNSIKWHSLIVDEGHRLKNSNCMLIRLLKKLDVSNRLLITGTPLQNNLNELWSLLNFILPDIFNDLELFQQWFNFDEYSNNLKTDSDEKKKEEKHAKLSIQESLVKNLHIVLKPFLLRRLKKDVVKNLPPKKEYLIHISLTDLQKKIYNDALNNNLTTSLVEVFTKEVINYSFKYYFKNKSDFMLIDEFLTEKFNNYKKSKSSKSNSALQEENLDQKIEKKKERLNKNNGTDITKKNLKSLEDELKNDNLISKDQAQDIILNSIYEKISRDIKKLSLQNLMIQLRNICGSPYIYYDPLNLSDHNNKKGSFENENLFIKILYENSAKFQVLNQLSEKLLSTNHKILIFTQFTKVLDLLHDWYIYNGIPICRLDGNSNHEQRDKEIRQFNNNPNFKVFILSTRAGGLGINLTAADTVFLFDNDWNPQMDLQAIDRVHRIGQVNPVKIFRFVIKNSIEEILITKSSSKRFLEKLIIQMGEFKFNKLKKLINDDTNSIDFEIKDLIELSKKSTKISDTKHENGEPKNEKSSSIDTNYTYNYTQYNFFNDKNYDKKILSDSEIAELLDRSQSCYDNNDDTVFENISIFETINNMDR